ncbi:hypothetical protein [Haladaptatus salinisoli]|uniref:hypothetical protein n=1 Tax=Haladaptatus salinisoli TaxID=2884876 RepID=UPI001D0B8D1F|nr:hypothetical protein [Haladaptatus salinisoli]
MKYTISLQDGAELELTEIGVATEGDTIAFSVEGRIEEINDDLIEVFEGKTLQPVAITFEAEEPEEE